MIEWVVEASTFCNMRCAYCYQWDGLDDRMRMPLELWRKVLRAACDYHLMQEERCGGLVSTRIIWHGGEPLTLPLDYLQSTFAMKDELVATAGIAPERMTTALQTNLFVLSDAAIEVLARHHVGFGVSFDVVRGVRLSVNGQPSEDRVLANLERLHRAEIECGAITVLARHTCPMICDIFDFWASRGMSFRVLPLFAGPGSREVDRFEVGETELVDALRRLFSHWMRSPSLITVTPLDEWLANVVRHLLGLRAKPYDRRRHGESVLVVRPNGTLFQVAEAAEPALAFGDLRHQTMHEILQSDAYLASLERSEDTTRRRCTGCQFRGGCDSWPAHTAAVDHPLSARCHVAFGVQTFIKEYLERAGLGAPALRELLAAIAVDNSAITVNA